MLIDGGPGLPPCRRQTLAPAQGPMNFIDTSTMIVTLLTACTKALRDTLYVLEQQLRRKRILAATTTITLNRRLRESSKSARTRRRLLNLKDIWMPGQILSHSTLIKRTKQVSRCCYMLPCLTLMTYQTLTHGPWVWTRLASKGSQE